MGVHDPMRRSDLGEGTCPSYLRTVCSNRLSCQISTFDSSHSTQYACNQ